MKRWAILLLALPGVAHAQPADGVFGSPFHFTETGGAAIYGSVCAGCHMADGRGAQGAGMYPSLVGDPHLAVSAYAVGVVLHGKRAMPAFGRLLSDRQVADVIVYLRQHFDELTEAGPTEAEVRAQR